MKTKQKVSAAAILAVALLGAAPAARAEEASAAVRTRIVALTAELMDALVPGKSEVWERILDPEAVVIDEFGRRQDKREAVASVRPLPKGFSGSIELRQAHVRQHGDVAVIDCEAYEQETVFGQQLVVRYIFLATYLRRGDDWKLVAMENVTLPTDPPALTVRGLRLDDYPGVYRYGPGRAFTIRSDGKRLTLVTRQGAKEVPLSPVARDVFMDGTDEKNLLIFQRDDAGRVTLLVERRKYNDLRMVREGAAKAP